MSLRTTLDAVFGSAWHVNHVNIMSSMLPAADGTPEANKIVTTDANNNINVGGQPIIPANSSRVGVAGGATIAITQALHDGKTVNFDTLTGTTATLPAATGSGMKVRFLVTVKATSNSHVIKVANASDFMVGLVFGERVDSGNAVLGFAAANSGTVATNSDTITLNRTTTGSVSVGEWVEVQDVAANAWAVSGMLSATGAAFATPFSAAV